MLFVGVLTLGGLDGDTAGEGEGGVTGRDGEWDDDDTAGEWREKSPPSGGESFVRSSSSTREVCLERERLARSGRMGNSMLGLPGALADPLCTTMDGISGLAIVKDEARSSDLKPHTISSSKTSSSLTCLFTSWDTKQLYR